MFVAHRRARLFSAARFPNPQRVALPVSPSPSAPPRCPRLRADPTARTRTTATHTAPSRSATGRARLIRLPGAGNRQPRRRRRRASTRSFRRARAGRMRLPRFPSPRAREGPQQQQRPVRDRDAHHHPHVALVLILQPVGGRVHLADVRGEPQTKRSRQGASAASAAAPPHANENGEQREEKDGVGRGVVHEMRAWGVPRVEHG